MFENDYLVFGQLLENFQKVFGNLRKMIVKKYVIGMFIYKQALRKYAR